MKKISIDNGQSFIEPEEALEEKGFELLHHYMDFDICNAVHDKTAPCTELEFLIKYLELAPDDFIIG